MQVQIDRPAIDTSQTPSVAQALPPEIWRRILAPMPERDVYRAAQTCRAAYTAGHDPSLLRPRYAQAYPDQPLPPLAPMLRRRLIENESARQKVVNGQLRPIFVAKKTCVRNHGSFGATFSGDGSYVAAWTSRRTVTLWHVALGGFRVATRIRLPRHPQYVVLSHNGLLAAMVPDSPQIGGQPIQIFNTQTRPATLVKTIDEHMGTLQLAEFTTDGSYFISASENESYDGHVRVSSLDHPHEEDLVFRDEDRYVHSAMLSAHGSMLSFVFESDEAYLIDLKTLTPLVRKFQLNDDHAARFQVAPTGRCYLRSQSVAGKVQTSLMPLNCPNNAPLWSLETPTSIFHRGVFSADGSRLVSCEDDNAVTLYQMVVPALPPKILLRKKENEHAYAEFSPNSRYLAVHSYRLGQQGDDQLSVWDLAAEAPLQAQLAPEASWRATFCFWRAGACLIATLASGASRIYDLDAWFEAPCDMPLQSYPLLPDVLTCEPLLFSPTGNLLVAPVPARSRRHRSDTQVLAAWGLTALSA